MKNYFNISLVSKILGISRQTIRRARDGRMHGISSELVMEKR